MTLTTLRPGIITLTSAMLFVSIGFADVIPVANPSFETLPSGGLSNGCGTGCFFSGDFIPGWTNSNNSGSGQFQPGTQDGTTTFFSTLSDGITSAYTDGLPITQTVGATVQTGVVYTLQVDLGRRNDSTGFASIADLLVNGTQYLATGVDPTPGNWSTFTATYTGLAADAGDPITIELRFHDFQQANFDNVRLSDNLESVPGVPEPSMLALLAAGLFGLAMWHRRRASSLTR